MPVSALKASRDLCILSSSLEALRLEQSTDSLPSQRMGCVHTASYENIMHATGRPAFGLQLTAAHGSAKDISDVEALRALRARLEGPRLERAIGVIYRPDTERFSHYYQT